MNTLLLVVTVGFIVVTLMLVGSLSLNHTQDGIIKYLKEKIEKLENE